MMPSYLQFSTGRTFHLYMCLTGFPLNSIQFSFIYIALGDSGKEELPFKRQKPRAEPDSRWAAICLDRLGYSPDGLLEADRDGD